MIALPRFVALLAGVKCRRSYGFIRPRPLIRGPLFLVCSSVGGNSPMAAIVAGLSAWSPAVSAERTGLAEAGAGINDSATLLYKCFQSSKRSDALRTLG